MKRNRFGDSLNSVSQLVNRPNSHSKSSFFSSIIWMILFFDISAFRLSVKSAYHLIMNVLETHSFFFSQDKVRLLWHVIIDSICYLFSTVTHNRGWTAAGRKPAISEKGGRRLFPGRSAEWFSSSHASTCLLSCPLPRSFLFSFVAIIGWRWWIIFVAGEREIRCDIPHHQIRLYPFVRYWNCHLYLHESYQRWHNFRDSPARS